MFALLAKYCAVCPLGVFALFVLKRGFIILLFNTRQPVIRNRLFCSPQCDGMLYACVKLFLSLTNVEYTV